MTRSLSQAKRRQRRAGIIFLLMAVAAAVLLLVAANRSALAWRIEQARAAWLDARSIHAESVPTPVMTGLRPTIAASPRAVSAAYEATRPVTPTPRPTSSKADRPTPVPFIPTLAPPPASAALTGFRFEY